MSRVKTLFSIFLREPERSAALCWPEGLSITASAPSHVVTSPCQSKQASPLRTQKTHNKSSCWEKWDPSAARGHNNKFPSGGVTHGPEPGTTTIIYLTQNNNNKNKTSLSSAGRQLTLRAAQIGSRWWVTPATFTFKTPEIKAANRFWWRIHGLHRARKNKPSTRTHCCAGACVVLFVGDKHH